MKNILKAIMALLFLGNVSCNDDLLEKAPLDQVTEATFYKSAADAVAAVNAVYDAFQNGNSSNTNFLYFDQHTANAISGSIGRNIHETTDGTVSWHWGWNYKGIARANIVTDNVPDIDMDVTLQNRVLAEARFFRAYFYTNLMMVFGDVPLFNTSQSVGEEFPSRTPRAQVLAQIIADLEFAETNLPDSYSGNDVGRATKGAAKSYLARIYIFEGQWAKGAAKANEVIASNLYELVADYSSQFFPSGENGTESILEVQFSGNIPGEGQAYSNAIAPSGLGLTALGGYNRYNPSNDFVNAFLATDGLPIATSPLYDPLNPYVNRDPRLDATVLHEGSIILGKTYDPSIYDTDFHSVKYIIGQEASTKDEFEQNLIAMRYAEVLLFYAEAQNEAIGPDASVYAAINKVRNRVSMPDVTPGLSQDALRQVIRDERRYEFGMEGVRYFDVLRWKTLPEESAAIIASDSPKEQPHDTFDPAKHYLWPIPQSELEINSNLSQNSGW